MAIALLALVEVASAAPPNARWVFLLALLLSFVWTNPVHNAFPSLGGGVAGDLLRLDVGLMRPALKRCVTSLKRCVKSTSVAPVSDVALRLVGGAGCKRAVFFRKSPDTVNSRRMRASRLSSSSLFSVMRR